MRSSATITILFLFASSSFAQQNKMDGSPWKSSWPPTNQPQSKRHGAQLERVWNAGYFIGDRPSAVHGCTVDFF